MWILFSCCYKCYKCVPLNCYLRNGWCQNSVTGGKKRMLEPWRIRKVFVFWFYSSPVPAMPQNFFADLRTFFIHKIPYAYRSFSIFWQCQTNKNIISYSSIPYLLSPIKKSAHAHNAFFVWVFGHRWNAGLIQ